MVFYTHMGMKIGTLRKEVTALGLSMQSLSLGECLVLISFSIYSYPAVDRSAKKILRINTSITLYDLQTLVAYKKNYERLLPLMRSCSFIYVFLYDFHFHPKEVSNYFRD